MVIPVDYITPPLRTIKTNTREISIFDIDGENIDKKVVDEFGEEWLKFNEFDEKTIDQLGDTYFDIIDESMVNEDSYILDIGCGSGRWTKYLSRKAGFIEAVDPSKAIMAANKLLDGIKNVRLTQASIDTLPFADNTFDFAMSVGVLHHIPDTRQALTDCVKKVRSGGYFYVYLYYDLDNRGPFYRFIFWGSNVLRRLVSKLRGKVKRVVCDILAVVIYLPVILVGRFLRLIGFKKAAERMPLHGYHSVSFFTIRNDALDRFGTRLEQRFSAEEVKEIMMNAGLTDIKISNNLPFYHAVGKKL